MLLRAGPSGPSYSRGAVECGFQVLACSQKEEDRSATCQAMCPKVCQRAERPGVTVLGTPREEKEHGVLGAAGAGDGWRKVNSLTS